MEPRAPQIILLPGAGGLNAQFKLFAERCGREMPVVALDYPDWLWQIENPGLDRLTAEMTSRISHRIAAGPIAITGYSLGAHIAAQIAESFVAGETAISWVAVIEPMLATSTGLGANLSSRLAETLASSLKNGFPALAHRLWILINRAGARLMLPLLVQGGGPLRVVARTVIPPGSLMARELKLRLMIAASVRQEPRAVVKNASTMCHVIQITGAEPDTAFWNARFSKVAFINIPGDHHSVMDGIQVISALSRISKQQGCS